MPNNQKKGLFDFASEHPFITFLVVSDLAAMVTNVVGYICGRGKIADNAIEIVKDSAKDVARDVVKETTNVLAEPTVEAEA